MWQAVPMGEGRMSGQRHSLAADWQASHQASRLASRQASRPDSDQASRPDSDQASRPDYAGRHPEVVRLGAARRELAMAREIRARELVAAAPPAVVAAA